MSLLATDNFTTATAATDLDGRIAPASPNTFTWAKQTGTYLITSAGRVRPSTTSTSIYAGYAPAVADYAVYVDSTDVATSNNGNAGPAGRITTTTTAGDTFYEVVRNPGGNYQLYVVKPGIGGGAGFIQLGSTYTSAFAAGTTNRVGLVMNGSAISATLNGVTIIGPITDNNITAAGKAGINGNGSGTPAWSDTVGVHLDNFEVDDFSLLTIAPNNAAWVVSPYNWLRTSTVDTTNSVGAYRRILYANSATLNLLFSAANTNAQIGVRFDGGANGAGFTGYTVSGTSLSITSPASRSQWRLLEICYMRAIYTADAWNNSPPTNALQFTGIQLDGTGTVLKPYQRPKNIVVAADSIGVGGNVINTTGATNFDRDDVTMTVGWNLQYALNAEVCIRAASGAAVNNTSNTSATNHWPALVNSYNLLWSGQSMDLTTVRPDAYVVMLGQNDPAGETGFQTALQTAVSGVNARKTFLVGDLKNNQQTNIAAVATALGATYIAPPAFDTALDTLDTVHPLAEFDIHKYYPTVAAGIYSVLYGAGTSNPKGSKQTGKGGH